MREAWKGMIIGALLGVLVGLALEAIKAMSKGARHAATEARNEAPAIAHEVAGFAGAASQSLRDSDIAGQAVQAAHRLGDQVKSAAESGRSAIQRSG
jgi:hypothetical protein